jgi:hypothetical protein
MNPRHVPKGMSLKQKRISQMSDKFWNGLGQPHELALVGQKLGATEADFTVLIQNPEMFRNVLLYARGEADIVFRKHLALVSGGITINHLKKPFVVANHFRLDTSDQAQVKISGLGSKFESCFLHETIKLRPGYQVSVYRLTKEMDDGKIRAELDVGHETDLFTVFSLMRKQGRGQPGVLLTSGNQNIFFCPDSSGVTRVVYVVWAGVGWGVGAGDPCGWEEGCQVFSRNSGTSRLLGF